LDATMNADMNAAMNAATNELANPIKPSGTLHGSPSGPP
jgi:hypothetical protein